MCIRDSRMSEWLYVIIALPFIVIALTVGGDNTNPTTGLLQNLSTIYLICLAVQEAYRHPSVGRPVVVHLSLIGVLFHAGMSYDLKLYPLFVLVYIGAALALSLIHI